MSTEEEDYSTLPLGERLVHKVWKARLGAYEEAIRSFENSRSDADECFSAFGPDSLKRIVTDSNVVAQQTGILVFAKYLELGGTPQAVDRLKSAGVFAALAEKGLASARQGTKDNTFECFMVAIEIGNPDAVVEDILPFATSRLPKLVAGVATALTKIIESFGCSVVSPKPIIEVLPKLFGHADRTVRTETSKLAVELYKWTRDGLSVLLFPNLKPIQQKDLTKAFEAVSDDTPTQQRLTRAQKAAQAQSDAGDVEMEDVEAPPPPKFDAFDLMEPVEVLTKLPADLSTRVASSLWKDRKEVLEEVHEVLSKAPKLVTSSDYGDLVRIFAKCMRDANIQVVQLAANGTEFVAAGLKKSFQKYQNIILVPMLERTKERKPAVAEALANALHAIFLSSSLSDILDGTLATMSHKTPQVKISVANFLQRCLAETTVAPTSLEVDSIIVPALKLLNDSQEPVRQAAVQLIGTLMKVVGERALRGALEKVDDNRKAMIMKVYESVQVKSTSSSTRPQPTSKPATEKVVSAFGDKKSRVPNLGPSIPSKRSATSPADRAEKSSTYGRGLTGRSLGTHPAPKLSPVASGFNKENEAQIDYKEFQALKQEKQAWLQEKQKLASANESLKNENYSLNQELTQTRQSLEKTSKEYNNASLMLKQKDTQILRLNSEIENSKLKVRDLEQTIEMMKLQSKASPELHPGKFAGSRSTSPFKEPGTRITSGELSSRVNRLSIDAEARKEIPDLKYSSPTKASYKPASEFDDSDESWRKAAEITNQLKARIEKMKARSRATASSLDV